jgi:hypothetical protein
MWTAIAFIALAIVHLLPIAPMFAPEALTRLYGVSPADSTLLVLLRHRAVLLAIVGILCLWASVSETTRPAALAAATLNIASFLAFYALYASPGPLRIIALVDLVAIAPLAIAAWGTFAART